MSNEQNGSAVFVTSGKILLLGGGAFILATGMFCIATIVLESPTNMYVLGLLRVLLMFTVAPLGCVALVLGVVLRFTSHVVARKDQNESKS